MTKTKNTKRALLSSALALVICMAMLIGSTFAWFTDSVTSGSNVIKAGNLDIDVQYTLDGENWADLNGAKDLFQKGLWEPGHTEVVALRIENKGSLALKYNANMNIINEIIGTNKDGGAIKLSDILTVSTLTQQANDDNGFGDITLALAFNGENSYYETTTTFKAGNVLGNDVELQPGVAHYVIVKVDMAETVGNEANAKDKDSVPSIEFGINVLATQFTEEYDSFGNQYDANAKYDYNLWDGVSKTEPVADENGVYHITTAAELVSIMDVTGNSIYLGKTIVLDNNINLAGKTVKGIGSDNTNFAGTFDGQGYTISNFKIDATNRTYYAGLFNQVANVGTVKNLTVKNATVMGNGMVGAVASSVDGNSVIDNCKAIDCTVIGVKKVGAVVGYSAGSTVTNNYAENCTVLYSEKEGGAILGYENTGSTVSNNEAKNVTVAQGTFASNTDALKNAIKNAPVGKETIISLAAGTYDGNIDITLAAMGQQGGDVVIKPVGGKVVLTGTVTLGYRNQGVGATMYNANVTFEGITFDHAAAANHSFDVQDVKSLTLRDCTIIGDGECGMTSARGNGTGASKIVGCTFKNAGMQLLGNFATGLVIENCTFDESCINVQAGNSVTVKNCEFSNTLTDANDNESFYVIRSNAIPITVTGCKFNIDSSMTKIGTAGEKGWGVFVNRQTANWTVTDVEITMTDAAQAQTALNVATCLSTGKINMTNVTLNGEAVQ